MFEVKPVAFSSMDDLERQMAAWSAEVGAGALALAEFDHAVLFARFSGGAVEWAPEAAGKGLSLDNLLDLRVFGREAEYHCWRTDDDSFAVRRATDGGEALQTDEWQSLWGTVATRVSQRPGWTRLVEERGTSFEVPLDCSSGVEGERAVRLIVRHYLRLDPATGLAGIADSRLVQLVHGGPAQ